VKRFYLTTVGSVDARSVESVKELISGMFGQNPVDLPELPAPDYAWDESRRQYGSVPVLERLAKVCPRDAWKLLAVTECDLFIPMLSFIYGQAQLDGAIAIVSLARLRQEFYGLPPHPDLALRRLRKEALHEVGHTFGLVHCPDAACVMSLATNIRLLDLKGDSYCTGCLAMLAEKLGKAGSIERKLRV
jgi:archaemetzincin